MKTFQFPSCLDIKITIMTSYFRIGDDFIKIVLNFTRFLPSIPPLIGYRGNNEWPILKRLIQKMI